MCNISETCVDADYADAVVSDSRIHSTALVGRDQSEPDWRWARAT
jgi:hypothetical protein